MQKFICEKLLEKEKFKFEDYWDRVRDIEASANPSKSLQTTMRVDGHLHSNASICQEIQSRQMILQVARTNEIVELTKDGRHLNFQEVLEEENIPVSDLSASNLKTLCDIQAKNNFGRFNSTKLLNNARIHKLVYAKGGPLKGLLYARMLREQLAHWKTVNQRCEMRFSLKGDDNKEFFVLADFFERHRILTDFGDVIHISFQVSRRTDEIFAKGEIPNFQTVLKNWFWPLITTSLNPEANPAATKMMSSACSFDMVDYEAANTDGGFLHLVPSQMNSKKLPVEFRTLLYYCYIHIELLNHIRREQNLNTLELNPHGLKTSSPSHAYPLFLLCSRYCHGRTLCENKQVQYLTLLVQQGLMLSLSSNAILFGAKVACSSLKEYQKEGLNCCLSSDDYHNFDSGGNNSVFRELDTAMVEADLTVVDGFELRLRSVLMSSFAQDAYTDAELKDQESTGVTTIRSLYRQQQLVALPKKLID